MDALIPIVAIMASIGFPAVVVVIALIVYHKRKLARYHVIERAIDSNASPEVVEQLIATINQESSKKVTSPRQKNLIEGTILMAVGIAFFIFRFVIDGTDFLGMLPTGVFPILIMLAIAKFIIAFFILKKDPEQL